MHLTLLEHTVFNIFILTADFISDDEQNFLLYCKNEMYFIYNVIYFDSYDCYAPVTCSLWF